MPPLSRVADTQNDTLATATGSCIFRCAKGRQSPCVGRTVGAAFAQRLRLLFSGAA
ncbi:MAG: hypothetical protein J6C65_01855 [Prevotella sp.]|nr:hypothetical protein [Prevotella sp.]MBO5204762.1 hypothetical protein [Prevotella sp.]